MHRRGSLKRRLKNTTKKEYAKRAPNYNY